MYIYIYIVIHRQTVSLYHNSSVWLTRVLNSFEELYIMREVAENSFARVSNPHGGAYILSSTDRLFRWITTLKSGISLVIAWHDDYDDDFQEYLYV